MTTYNNAKVDQMRKWFLLGKYENLCTSLGVLSDISTCSVQYLQANRG